MGLEEAKLMADDAFRALLELTDSEGRPNINALWRVAKDLEAVKLNLKFFGYDLARQLTAALPVREGLEPRPVGLASKACTQEDLESDWAAYWCGQLKIPVMFHRKLWELAYVLQALYERGRLEPGMRGLGFGCGEEPIASYLTSRQIQVTITDLPPDQGRASGWTTTHQHASELRRAHHAHLVELEAFESLATLRYVDMNAIPPSLEGYDFCWSICALEHLGSIGQGLQFIENSLAALKPGGIAVHTTEFNYLRDGQTIDNWPTVLFTREHFCGLYARMSELGHIMAELDFRTGARPMDRFIDVPPYDHDLPVQTRSDLLGAPQHLKLTIDGFPSTCFGVVIQKAGA
jgi:hypothetical protein